MKNLIILLFFCLLSACATKPLVSHSMPASQEGPPKNWALSGALSIRDLNTYQQFHFLWQQHEENYHLELFGPLGLSTVVIEGNPQQVTLRRSAQKTRIADTPEHLMKQELGYTLPLTPLFYWIRGLPAPTPPNGTQKSNSGSSKTNISTLVHEGHLNFLEQDSWKVYFERYENHADRELPKKLRLVNSGSHLIINLIIAQWDLNYGQ